MSNPYVQEQTIRCAGPNCEQVRRDTNHWFVVVNSPAGFNCRPMPIGELFPDEKPVCGQSCAVKLFEHWMTK